MRLVFGLVLIIGVGLAGFAVYMAQGFISQMTAERDMLLAARAQAKPTVEIFAVNKPKKYGEPLAREDLTKIIWQEDSLPEGTFQDVEQLFPEGQPARLILRPMEKFEPILSVKVTEPGKDAGIDSRLGKGMSAFTISVDATSGVSGFLRPGNKVDVYWTGRVRDRDVSKRIEASVELVAVDQTSDSNATKASIARTVTVLVTPQQAANLSLAQNTGDLTLSLVGNDDLTETNVVEVDQRRLLGIVEQQAPKVEEAAKVCYSRVRKGAEVIQQQIPCRDQ